MTFKETIRATLKDFESLLNAIYFSGWKVFGYLLFLSLLLSLPITKDLATSFSNTKRDITTITKQVPDFKIEDNTLTVDNAEKGGIFLTDSFILTLDEKGSRTPENIQQDATNSALSVGFLPHEVIFGMPHGLSDFFPEDSLHFSYEAANLNGFSKENLEKIPTFFPKNLLLIFFLVAFLFTIFDFLITLLLITLVGMLFARSYFLQLPFGKVFKIIVFSSTWGVLLATILGFFKIPFDSIFLIGIPTTLVFYQMLHRVSFPQKK